MLIGLGNEDATAVARFALSRSFSARFLLLASFARFTLESDVVLLSEFVDLFSLGNYLALEALDHLGDLLTREKKSRESNQVH